MSGNVCVLTLRLLALCSNNEMDIGKGDVRFKAGQGRQSKGMLKRPTRSDDEVLKLQVVQRINIILACVDNHVAHT